MNIIIIKYFNILMINLKNITFLLVKIQLMENYAQLIIN